MLPFSSIFTRDISFEIKNRYIILKERTDRARICAAYPLISDVSSTCMYDVHTQCGFMPLASSWRPRKEDADIPSA